MNENKLRRLFANASESFIRSNCDSHSRAVAKLEPSIRNDALAAPCIKEKTSGRVLVSVKSFRRRLLDEDGLCEKYHVDLCRYSGIISSDAPGKAKIEVSQEKVGSKELEEIIITITKAS